MTVRLKLDSEALAHPAVIEALVLFFREIGRDAAIEAVEPAVLSVLEMPAPVVSTAPTIAAPSEPPAEASAPSPARPTHSIDAVAAYARFEAGLSGRTLQFLQLLRARGTMTLDEIMTALELDSPKALGGITGSVGRWVPTRGLPLPYEVITQGGERVWRWTGPAALPLLTAPRTPRAPLPPSADARAAKAALASPTPPSRHGAPQRPATTPQGPSLVKSTPLARPTPPAPPPSRVAAPRPPARPALDPEMLRARLMASITGQSRRFMEFLRDKRQATTAEVILHLGLARAKALTDVLESLGREAERVGLTAAYDVSVTPTGERMYVWPGHTVQLAPEQPRRSDIQVPSGPRIIPFRDPTGGNGITAGPGTLAPRIAAAQPAGAPGVFKRKLREVRR